MIQKIKIGKIKGNPINPRIVKNEKFRSLVESIKSFPQMLEKRPIVVDADFMILGGNMRWKACAELGVKEVYVIVAEDWTPEQQAEFIIKDNGHAGEWDWDVLANAWEPELLKEWGMDVWQPGEVLEEDVEPYEPTPDFNDEGVGYKAQYGVITECKDEAEQERVFKSLSSQGLKCKIVVT